MAIATRHISFSEFSPLKRLTAHATNRQLSWVYPRVGSILSMLGESACRFPFRSKDKPQTSHFPVQRASAHSGVRLYSRLFCNDLALAACMGGIHGLS